MTKKGESKPCRATQKQLDTVKLAVSQVLGPTCHVRVGHSVGCMRYAVCVMIRYKGRTDEGGFSPPAWRREISAKIKALSPYQEATAWKGYDAWAYLNLCGPAVRDITRRFGKKTG